VDQIEALFARVRHAHRVSIRFEPVVEGAGHLPLVLDHKDMHASLYRGATALFASDRILMFF
jgi:hypothetical protein